MLEKKNHFGDQPEGHKLIEDRLKQEQLLSWDQISQA